MSVVGRFCSRLRRSTLWPVLLLAAMVASGLPILAGGSSAIPPAAPSALAAAGDSSVAVLAVTHAQAVGPLSGRFGTVAVVTFTVTNLQPWTGRPSNSTAHGADAHTLRNIVLTDDLAPGVDVASAVPTVERHGRQVVWHIGDIAPHQGARATITLRLDARGAVPDRLDDGAIAWTMRAGRLVTAQAPAVAVAVPTMVRPRMMAAALAPDERACLVTAVPLRPMAVGGVGDTTAAEPAAAATDCPSPVASPSAGPSTTPSAPPSGTSASTSTSTAEPSGTPTAAPSDTTSPQPSATSSVTDTASTTPGTATGTTTATPGTPSGTGTTTATPGTPGTGTPGTGTPGTGTPGTGTPGTGTPTATNTITQPVTLPTTGPGTTDTPYPYTTPSATSTPRDCSFDVAGWTFRPTPCPDLSDPGAVDNVQVTITPPASIQVVGDLPNYQVEVEVTADHGLTLVGSIKLPDVKLKFLNFTFQIQDTSLSNEGLYIGLAELALVAAPSQLDSCATPTDDGKVFPLGTITGLRVDRDLNTSAGSITLYIYTARVEATNVHLSMADGFEADTLTVALPELLRVKASVTGENVRIHRDGSVEGTLAGFEFAIGASESRPDGALSGKVGRASFTDGIHVSNVRVTLPIVGTNKSFRFTLDGFTYDGTQFRLDNARIDLPEVSIAGVKVEGSVMLSLTLTDSAVLYHFAGYGKVEVPALGALRAYLEIGSVGPGHPSNLYAVSLRVDAGNSIPIPSTPFALKGIRGGMSIDEGRDGRPRYTFELGAHIESALGRNIVKGLFDAEVSAVVTTDGDLGLKGRGTLLRVIDGRAGLCVHLSDAQGGTCGGTIEAHPNLVRGQGAYIEATGNAELEQIGSLRIDDAYGRMSEDDLSARFSGSGNILGLEGQATGTFGKFNYNNEYTVWGIKAEVTGSLFGYSTSAAAFFGVPFEISVYYSDYYQLVQPPDGGALVPRLANATPSWTRRETTLAGQGSNGVGSSLGAARARVAARVVTGSFDVAPGQSPTFLTLAWRRGAPTLTLIAPDGRTLTPRHPGPYGKPISSADRRQIPAGTRRLVGIYIAHPLAGRWQVHIGNLAGNEGFRFAVRGAPALPVLRVAGLRHGRTVVARGPRGFVNLGGTLRGGRSGARTVSLYYTAPAGRTRQGRPGLAPPGVLIASSIPARGGVWRYHWHTGRVPAGSYSVYATLDNGMGPDVTAYAGWVVRVVQPPAPRPTRPIRASRGHGKGAPRPPHHVHAARPHAVITARLNGARTASGKGGGAGGGQPACPLTKKPKPGPQTPTPTTVPSPTALPSPTPFPTFDAQGFAVGPYYVLRNAVKGRGTGLQIHHILQNAAFEYVRNTGRVITPVAGAPVYNINQAPSIALQGGAVVPGTEHFFATLPQRMPIYYGIKPACGKYGIEVQIGQQGLENLGLRGDQVRQIMTFVNQYFKNYLRYKLSTTTLCPNKSRDQSTAPIPTATPVPTFTAVP